MSNCFGSGNSTLWLLILVLIFCCCGGSVCGILDKIGDCSCLLPLVLVYCCCCKNDKGFNFGCGCK